MEYVMGIKGKGFAMVCVSSTAVQQIITMKHEEDKCMAVDSHRMLVTSGEPGDRVQFGDFICANIRLRNMRHQVTTSTKAVASYARQELAKALRQKPYQANLLVAVSARRGPGRARRPGTTDARRPGVRQGYDKGKGDASLYYLDYIATLKEMNVSGYGYGSWFVLSMFDR